MPAASIADDSEGNRWRMRQYPIGTPHHADRYVQWFNDCFRVFQEGKHTAAAPLPETSWFAWLRQDPVDR
jgi:hypothetical protein